MVETRASEAGFVECVGVIERVEDVFGLLDAGSEHSTQRFLLDSSHLPDAFFDLRSGFAGEFLQKLQNYGLIIAVTFASEDGYSDRFKEFLREARRGPQFRVFTERAAAETWLAGGR